MASILCSTTILLEAQEKLLPLPTNPLLQQQTANSNNRIANVSVQQSIGKDFSLFCEGKPPQVAITFAKNPNCNAADGSINISIKDGQAPFSIFLNTELQGVTDEQQFTFSNLPSNAYFIVVEDAFGRTSQVHQALNDIGADLVNEEEWLSTNKDCEGSGSIFKISLIGSDEPPKYALYASDGEVLRANVGAILLPPRPVSPGIYYVERLSQEDGTQSCRAYYIIEIKETPIIENLPFVDDFSNSLGYPNGNNWQDRQAFINNTYAFEAPSSGVATLDGLDAQGQPYYLADVELSEEFVLGGADTLTSRPFCLANDSWTNADSIYVNFFYQAQGFGDYPNESDSLILEFKKPKLFSYQCFADPNSADSLCFDLESDFVLVDSSVITFRDTFEVSNPILFDSTYLFYEDEVNDTTIQINLMDVDTFFMDELTGFLVFVANGDTAYHDLTIDNSNFVDGTFVIVDTFNAQIITVNKDDPNIGVLVCNEELFRYTQTISVEQPDFFNFTFTFFVNGNDVFWENDVVVLDTASFTYNVLGTEVEVNLDDATILSIDDNFVVYTELGDTVYINLNDFNVNFEAGRIAYPIPRNLDLNNANLTIADPFLTYNLGGETENIYLSSLLNATATDDQNVDLTISFSEGLTVSSDNNCLANPANQQVCVDDITAITFVDTVIVENISLLDTLIVDSTFVFANSSRFNFEDAISFFDSLAVILPDTIFNLTGWNRLNTIMVEDTIWQNVWSVAGPDASQWIQRGEQWRLEQIQEIPDFSRVTVHNSIDANISDVTYLDNTNCLYNLAVECAATAPTSCHIRLQELAPDINFNSIFPPSPSCSYFLDTCSFSIVPCFNPTIPIRVPFIRVNVDLPADGFNFDGFQFRFRNKATISGNNDHWHLDYVRVNTVPINQGIQDVATTTAIPSILKNYQEIPWKHFKNNWQEALVDNLVIGLQNNDNQAFGVPENEFLIEEICTNDTLYQDLKGSQNISANELQLRNFNLQQARLPFDLNRLNPIQLDEADSIVLQTRLAIDAGGDENEANDTLSRQFRFFNHYAYDDGTAERAYGLFGVQAKLAYQFDILETDELTGIQINFLNMNANISEGQVLLAVWTDIEAFSNNDSLLYLANIPESPQFIDHINGFWTYTLEQAVSVEKGQAIYIGFIQQGQEQLNIGYDMNNNSVSRILFNSSGQWLPSVFDGVDAGALMMRPVFGELPTDGLNVSVEEPVLPTNSVQIYPNPTREQLYFAIAGQAAISQIKVYDFAGRLVITQSLSSNQTLSVGHLSAGIYLLKTFDTQQEEVSTHKFVKR